MTQKTAIRIQLTTTVYDITVMLLWYC